VYVSAVPGTIDATPSVFVIDSSAVVVKVSVSVAVLFAGVGSVDPPGSATLAVLVSDPVALGEIVPVIVKVAVPLGTSVTEALIEPVPDAAHDEPAEATHDQVTPERVAGMVSVTVAPVIVEGPAFEATTLYVTDVPGTSVVEPSVLVMTRSAVGVSVSLSVAVLLPATRSVIPAPTDAVAVFASVPVAPAATVPVMTNVAAPPTGRSTEALMLPLPDAGHVAPPLTVHVQVTPETLAGMVSVTFEAGAEEGPALDATTV
jgi:hypothetical protein